MKPTKKRTLRSFLTLAVGVAALSLPGWGWASDLPAVGTYAGPLPQYVIAPEDSHYTSGYLCLKISSRQAMTGTVQVAGRLHRVPRGVVLDADGRTEDIVLVNPKGVTYPVKLRITRSGEYEVWGEVTVGDAEPLHFNGYIPDGYGGFHGLAPVRKYSRNNPPPGVGLFTAGFEQFEAVWQGYEDIWPEYGLNRHGYCLGKISNSGIVTYKGLLPNGEKFRGSTHLSRHGPNIYSLNFYSPFGFWVYGVTNRGMGSVVGAVGFDGLFNDSVRFQRNQMVDIFRGELRWYPDPTTTPGKRAWLAVEGAEYTPPFEGESIFGQYTITDEGEAVVVPDNLAANLLQDPAAPLNSPAGINALLSGPLGGAPNPSLRPVPPYPADLIGAGAPSDMTIYFKPRDGSFKYVFIHPGTLRKTTGYGAVVQHEMEVLDMDGDFSREIVPGFGSGVFLNKVRNPDGSTTIYPGWMVFDPQPVP